MDKELIAAWIGTAAGIVLTISAVLFVGSKVQGAISDKEHYRSNVTLAMKICANLSPEPRPSRKECRLRVRELYDPVPWR